MRQLHWFQTDLRLADNPALASTEDATTLLCVYLMPKPRPWCNLTGLGPQRERFLRETVESVMAQTYGNWELLLVDDGSTDAGTRSGCDEGRRGRRADVSAGVGPAPG